MSFLELPIEIRQEIFHHAITHRGWKRGMRLRLVSKQFANEIIQCLYAYKMMDDFFRSTDGYGSLSSKPPLPPFTASYLKYRVRNEPPNGYARLRLIKEIAEELHAADGNMLKGNIELDSELAALCSLVAENGSLRHIFQPGPLEQNEASEGLYVAAIHRDVRQIIAEKAPQHQSYGCGPSLLGSVALITARYGTRETIDLINPNINVVILCASKYGRVETVKYLFERAVRNFQGPGPARNLSRLSDRVTFTPSVELYDYVMEWRQKHPELIRDRTHFNLRKAAERGWTDMARHVFQLGANPDFYPDARQNASFNACRHGYEEIVQLLIEHAANTDGAMAIAARHGHERIVQNLIAHGADTKGALSAAAIGGHISIVRTLVDHRVSPQEISQEAFVAVVKLEHETLLKLLIEKVGKWDRTVYQECLKAAKEEGLSSMEILLHESRYT